MENQTKVFKRGDMVKCNYAPNETVVGEVIGYTPDGDIEVILSITKKRTKTVDKVTTTLKPSAVSIIELLYIDSDENDDDSGDENSEDDDD